MFHEVKVRDLGNGWYEIVERWRPNAPWNRIATAWGDTRAQQIARLCRSALADPLAVESGERS